MSEHRTWPALICPECESDACAEMATKWAGEEIKVQCAQCGHFGPRPTFSFLSEDAFVRYVHRLTRNMKERVARKSSTLAEFFLEDDLENYGRDLTGGGSIRKG